MKFEEKFNALVAKYLQNSCPGLNVDKVVSVTSSTEQGGFCDTCAYEYSALEVAYLDISGKKKRVEIAENFMDFMESLFALDGGD